MENTAGKLKTRDLAYIAIFAVLMAVCSWISVPFTVPFTLQTFAVFTAAAMLGGKRGTVAVIVYILLGAVGMPVFSGFQGGVGALLGPTGGYIVGFVVMALIYWAVTARFGDKTAVMAAAMALGLIACYAFGTAWFVFVYTRAKGAVSVGAALGWCVIPYIIPDLVKLAAAILLTKKLKKRVKI